MKFWDKSSFKLLKAEWYEILEEDGFVDIESDTGSRDHLKQWTRNKYRENSIITQENKQTYYALLGSYAQKEQNYDSVIDAIVMRQYALGVKAEDIVIYLKSCGYSRERRTIYYIVRRYEHKWGIRKWTPKQMKQTPPTL